MGTKRKSSTSTPKFQPEEQKRKLELESSSSEQEEEEESEYEPEAAPESESSSSEEEEESEDEATKRQSVRKLLEPFTKDQIIQLFKTAASNDPSILSRVKTLADTDPTHRKIFVHGLGYDTTLYQLHAAFEPYGEIEECKLITDKVTQRAKGYAFVLFKTRVGAKRALKEPQKKIGNRNTSCQLAAVGPAGAGSDSVENATNSNANHVIQQIDSMNYGFGMSPGILSGASMNGLPLLMGQNMGFGVNPMLGLSQAGLAASGFNPSFAGIGAGYGLNSINPGVIGSRYGAQPALQGLGTYPSAQIGQHSFGGTAAMTTVTTPAKDSSGIGSAGVTYPSYLGR
ncbi:UBP1-associated proteins 1A [Nicotiana tabacum]|uniref:UBP1-associated proteins 1A n=2 Tax=Nicotiana TaxID=4085 RepID=A0A1S4CQU8_TOBAC|nr:PREDICTED: UBP1-associated proteins 1A-like [Nicotiana sylvestris]XP_016503436.1 PREDICTED: UBP1-associated proteins 1A-like [Nicotiana tabacum]